VKETETVSCSAARRLLAALRYALAHQKLVVTLARFLIVTGF